MNVSACVRVPVCLCAVRLEAALDATDARLASALAELDAEREAHGVSPLLPRAPVRTQSTIAPIARACALRRNALATARRNRGADAASTRTRRRRFARLRAQENKAMLTTVLEDCLQVRVRPAAPHPHRL
jgi:hypothetical protein